ncbi:MAG: trypsin-like serine protease [Cohaesibacter sp.]|nr:trypsin-like serine protease [Cohaesibacter sp.]
MIYFSDKHSFKNKDLFLFAENTFVPKALALCLIWLTLTCWPVQAQQEEVSLDSYKLVDIISVSKPRKLDFDFLAQQENRISQNDLGERQADKVSLGAEIDVKHLTFVVKITYQNKQGQQQLCTGVIIDDKHVLTAGHCACGLWQSYEVTIFTPDVEVFSLERPPLLYNKAQCHTGTGVPGFDLSLLRIKDLEILQNTKASESNLYIKLRQQFASKPDIAIIQMLDIYRDKKAKKLIVAGWGQDENKVLPPTLRVGAIGIYKAFCSTGVATCSPFREFILSNPLTFPNALAIDTCPGDSGGPVFYSKQIFQEKSDEIPPKTLLFLAGITSRGLVNAPHIPTANLCGGGGIYTNVGHKDVLNWLRQNGVAFKNFSAILSELRKAKKDLSKKASQ